MTGVLRWWGGGPHVALGLPFAYPWFNLTDSLCWITDFLTIRNVFSLTDKRWSGCDDHWNWSKLEPVKECCYYYFANSSQWPCQRWWTINNQETGQHLYDWQHNNNIAEIFTMTTHDQAPAADSCSGVFLQVSPDTNQSLAAAESLQMY